MPLGALGTATATVNYTYGDSQWGDLLTGYNGNTITSDAIGNMLSDGTWTYTWEHGRELATMSNGTTTWTYTYNADGMRTSRSSGTTTYSYIYNGSKLTQMTVGSDTLYFTYDASTPMSVTYNNTTYYYVTNLQGDVIAILNSEGTPVVTYTYDAWGNHLSTDGTMASTLGTINPLRYRGYVYDQETGLYYLQSRYYNPEMGRFINADEYVSTGQGILGNNMFAYCGNNPVNYVDATGNMESAAVQEAANWLIALLALIDSATPFLEIAAIVGTIIAGVAVYYSSKEESKDQSQVITEAGVTNSEPSDTIIYRYYATREDNLAPRVGRDYDGLSFSSKPPKPGVNAVATTVNTVNATGILRVVYTGNSHYLIVPMGESVLTWMNQGKNSIYSRVLSMIVVEIEG